MKYIPIYDNDLERIKQIAKEWNYDLEDYTTIPNIIEDIIDNIIEE